MPNQPPPLKTENIKEVLDGKRINPQTALL